MFLTATEEQTGSGCFALAVLRALRLACSILPTGRGRTYSWALPFLGVSKEVSSFSIIPFNLVLWESQLLDQAQQEEVESRPTDT